MNSIIVIFFIYKDLLHSLFPFKNSYNSLRYRAFEYIKNQNNKLYLDTVKYKNKSVIHYFLHRNRWWFVILIVLIQFFILPLFTFKVFSFIHITYTTAGTIVDQRTANIAAIISMTLVVVGFLINNLAVKDPYSYAILFRYSYLYPIIYFTLTTIGCFIILSTFRDVICDKNYFIKSVLIGTSNSLFILILISILFIRITTFSNSREIKKIFNKELMNESRRFLLEGLLEKYSRQEYNKFMLENGVPKRNIFENLQFVYNNTENKESNLKNLESLFSQQKVIYDINLYKIKKILNKVNYKNTDLTIRHSELYIGFLSNSPLNTISISEKSLTDRDYKLLQSSVIYKNQVNNTNNNLYVRNYFDTKFEELVEENKFKEVESILNSYVKLYELKISNSL